MDLQIYECSEQRPENEFLRTEQKQEFQSYLLSLFNKFTTLLPVVNGVLYVRRTDGHTNATSPYVPPLQAVLNETLKRLKKTRVNSLSSCLPIFAKAPVFFSAIGYSINITYSCGHFFHVFYAVILRVRIKIDEG